MKILTCGCCGERAPGKQHWNQDTGFGLCPRCVLTILKNPRAGVEELKGYGKAGENFAVPLPLWVDGAPGAIVAWKTAADDGEFHGWHVGTLRAWDSGTAIIKELNGAEVAVRAD